MAYEVQVKQLPAQHVAAVRMTASMASIAKDIHEGFADLMEAMVRAGVSPSAPPFIVYHQLGDQVIGEIEVCAPVREPFEDVGEARGARIPEAEVAWTIHRGPYDKVGAAYEALTAWIEEQGREIDGPPREVYLTDPEETPDPGDNVTEVQFPIR